MLVLKPDIASAVTTTLSVTILLCNDAAVAKSATTVLRIASEVTGVLTKTNAEAWLPPDSPVVAFAQLFVWESVVFTPAIPGQRPVTGKPASTRAKWTQISSSTSRLASHTFTASM